MDEQRIHLGSKKEFPGLTTDPEAEVSIHEQIEKAFEETHPSVTPSGTRVSQEHALPSVATIHLKGLEELEEQKEEPTPVLFSEVVQGTKKPPVKNQGPTWVASHPCMAFVFDLRRFFWRLSH